jgi:hypothetical protein
LKKLTENNKVHSSKGASLTTLQNIPFKISISRQLDNNFAFKDLKPADLKALHNFISQTIGEKLTITEVDKLFLRTKGGVTQNINNEDVIHYGKDRTKFRVFGYYNSENYFNITRIDPKHETNKK